MRFDSRFTPASWRRPVLYLLALGSLTLIDGCESGRSKRLPTSGYAAMFSRLVRERGALPYLARTYSAPGVPTDSKVSGLVIMRQPADLRPIGGDYYDDGYGNLIGFGSFAAPKLGGRSSYALTFRKKGGMQLAIDFRDDMVVDVLVELDRDGRLGALADPDAQWLLDCIAQEIGGGSNLAAAANHCLKNVGGGGGGGGGLGGGAGLEADRLSEPDCSKRGGPPGSVTQGGGGDGTVVINLDNGDTIYAESTQNEDGTTTLTVNITDSEGRVVYSERTTLDESGRETSSEISRITYNRDGSTRVESERREGGRVVESADRTFGPRIDRNFPNVYEIEIEIGRARIEPSPRRGGSGPTRQPGPECEDCPVEDPRCAEAPNDIASLWDCQAETDMSLLECLKHMQDMIYTATGGRCAVVVGADDRPNITCADQRLMECLRAGGNVEECLRSAGYHGDAESIGPENDDFFRSRYGGRRGRVGMYIDSTPVGAAFIGFCGGGAEQFCPPDIEILAR